MKILVIDDDFIHRRILSTFLESFGVVEAADSGTAGLTAFRKSLEEGEPCELVMLDIVMPDIDGIDVLSVMRETEKEFEGVAKRAIVLMTSSYSEKDTVLAAIRIGANGFIVKPYDGSAISKKLKEFGITSQTDDSLSDETDRQISIRKTLTDVIQKFKRGDIELPPFPDVVVDVERVINLPGSTIDDLSQAIEKDAVISSKLLATANSPLYRGLKQVYSVKQAVNRLGFGETQRVVMALANDSFYKTGNRLFKELMERLRVYSLASAHAAGLIAQRLGFKDKERFFLIGLIHDIGSALLLWILGEVTTPEEGIDLNEVVSSIRDMHTSFGAVLLQKWEFPQEFIEVAKMYEGPKFHSRVAKEILIANLAANLALKQGYGFYELEKGDLSELDSSRLLQLDTAALEAIGSEVKEILGQ